jgi:hypothetical protein
MAPWLISKQRNSAMAKILADRVLEGSTTTGTGAYTLDGAIAGYQAASTVCANGDTFDYFVEQINDSGVPTGAWETGTGTWYTGNILMRSAVHGSSNSGAAVSWSAGKKRVGLGLTATSLGVIIALAATIADGLLQIKPYSSNYSAVLADMGAVLLHPATDTVARMFTIPGNEDVAFPVGTVLTLVNQAGAGTITIVTPDTMRIAGNGATGPRTLDPSGLATAMKLAPTEWIISGVGLV